MLCRLAKSDLFVQEKLELKKNRARLVVVVSLLAVPAVYLTVRWATPIVQWIGFGVKTELRNYADFKLAGVVVCPAPLN